MSSRASYSEGAGFGLLSFLSLALLGVGSSIAIARVYGVEVIGEFGLVVVTVNAVFFTSLARNRPALVRELAVLEPRHPRVTGLFAAVLAFSLAMTLAAAVLVMVGAYLVFAGPVDRPDLFVPALVNTAGYVVLTHTCFNLDTIFAGFRAGRDLFWIRLHQAFAFLLIAVATGLVLDIDTVWGLILAQIGSYATALVHRLVAVRRYMRLIAPGASIRDGFRTLPDVVRFGLKIAPGGVADGVSTDSATWILGATAPIATVGAYSRGYLVARRLMDFNWRLNEMLFPTLVERKARGDGEGYDRALVDSLRYGATFMLLPAAVGGGAAYGVMDLFGPGFSQGADALALLLVAPALATGSNMLRHVLYAADRPLLGSASAGVRMVTTLATTIPLAVAYGATGAAAGLLAGYVADLAFMSGHARRQLTKPLRSLWTGRQALAGVLAFGVAFGFARIVYDALPGVGGLAVSLVLGTAAYAAVVVGAGGLNSRDRRRLSELAVRLRSGRPRPAPAAP